MFHIGVAKRQVYKKKKARHIFTSKIYMSSIPTFKPYTGPRWLIPSGLKVSESVKAKFGLFETLEGPFLSRHIASSIKRVGLISVLFNNKPVNDWDDLYSSKTSWISPLSVTSAIQRFYAIQKNEFKQIKILYATLYRFTTQIKKLMHGRIIYKSLQNVKNTNDAVTLDPPIKPVYVLDYTKRLSYVYEASTLRRTIENRILFSEHMFPDPTPPVNMFSNEAFTRGQLFSIIDQCRAYGEFSWILDRFKRCECDLYVFEQRFKQDLKIEAINSYFRSQREYAKDTIIDYFELYADSVGLDDHMINSFTQLYDKGVEKNMLHPYIQQWSIITRRYYCAVELKDLVELNIIKLLCLRLIRQAIKIFSI